MFFSLFSPCIGGFSRNNFASFFSCVSVRPLSIPSIRCQIVLFKLQYMTNPNVSRNFIDCSFNVLLQSFSFLCFVIISASIKAIAIFRLTCIDVFIANFGLAKVGISLFLLHVVRNFMLLFIFRIIILILSVSLVGFKVSAPYFPAI